MSWDITYSKSNDFNNNVGITYLTEQINTNINITPILKYIIVKGDDVILTFDSEVIGTELTYLNNLILGYINDVPTINRLSYLPLINNEIDSDKYEQISAFSSYSGLNETIQKICFLADVGTPITDFTIRLTERKSGDVYIEKTITDTSKTVYCLTDIPQLPLTESIMELHCKKNGGNKKDIVHFHTIYLYI